MKKEPLSERCLRKGDAFVSIGDRANHEAFQKDSVLEAAVSWVIPPVEVMITKLKKMWVKVR